MRFSKDHEWVELKDGIASIGITAYAAGQLGDVVFIELPAVGKEVKAGDDLAVVESVKAASDVYAPVSGEVVEANTALTDAPDTVNAMPELDGWFVKLKVANPAEFDALMDRAAYEQFLSTL
jgi:glycine cleavage system H protein